MLIPRYWAEARVQDRSQGRQVTVRRFGWSHISQQDAASQAESRAREALQRILSGDKLRRRELKVPYGGIDGLPIREEIVREAGPVVITRNSYGALCLNTPNVLFVDVDLPAGPSGWLVFSVFLALLCLGGVVAILLRIWWVGVIGAGVAVILFGPISLLIYRTNLHWAGGPRMQARRRIEKFVDRHPDWNVRLYETPAGWRILAVHRLFEPTEQEVADCFRAVRADSIYVRMCLAQKCFRARLTPKPWRIGISEHLRPRPGVWPIAAERLPMRQAWISEYEAAAANFSACRFVAALGLGTTHAAALAVQRLHDEVAKAESGLPIA